MFLNRGCLKIKGVLIERTGIWVLGFKPTIRTVVVPLDHHREYLTKQSVEPYYRNILDLGELKILFVCIFVFFKD